MFSNSGQAVAKTIKKLELHHSNWRLVWIYNRDILWLTSCACFMFLESISAANFHVTCSTIKLLMQLVGVLGELSSCREAFVAQGTVKDLTRFPVHLQLVALQTCWIIERLVTKFTQEFFDMPMYLDVL